jgi:hypothetical protein
MMGKHSHRALVLWNLIAGLLWTGVFLIAPTPAQAQQKPNILFILVDNLGYGELGVYGGGAPR